MELIKEPKRGLYLTKYNDEKVYYIDLHRNNADGTPNYVEVDSNGDSLYYGSSSNSNSNNSNWWESISDNLGDWFSGIGSIIGNIKGNTPTNNHYYMQNPTESDEKSNTKIIIAIAVVFLILIIIVFLFLKNKK